MKKIVLVYDDTIKVNDRIKTIIGNKSFGDITLKRKKLFTKIQEASNLVKGDIDFLKINKINDFKNIKLYAKDTIFFHLLSNMAVNNLDEFKIILEKLKYINETTILYDNKNVAAIFSNRDDYYEFLSEYLNINSLNFLHGTILNTNIFTDLQDYNNLIMYITSGFDARFFNSLNGDKYTVSKRSNDKNKMRMEYTYYWILPERMKSWMVMPYDYKEEEKYATYTMERMPMTDLAIRWTHGAIDKDEFNSILEKTFYFLDTREKKNISKEEYKDNMEKLYIKKIDDRINSLKSLDEFKIISEFIKNGTKYNSIDDIVNVYKELYNKYALKELNKRSYNLVIGHGDVFFANMLYSKETGLLKFIDPKGAKEEKDLWMNPYYDVAKLSHSICGNYDFFNVDDYTIEINKNMNFELLFNFDNREYKEIFKKFLDKHGYNFKVVRIYEASLFLSMLPLHIDNLHKVFAFILNAINILEEIENDK